MPVFMITVCLQKPNGNGQPEVVMISTPIHGVVLTPETIKDVSLETTNHFGEIIPTMVEQHQLLLPITRQTTGVYMICQVT